MTRSLGRSGRRWRRAREILFTQAPDVCAICAHPGTTDADHDPPLKELERLGLDPCDLAFLRRTHGVRGCPTCGRKCNQEKGGTIGYTPAAKTSRNW
jgi:hypothetical protein